MCSLPRPEVTGRPAALEDSDPVVRTLDRLSGGWGRGGWTVRWVAVDDLMQSRARVSPRTGMLGLALEREYQG